MKCKALLLIVVGLSLCLAGCGNEEPKETPEMKEALSGKKGFDMNNVPEKDREMVRKMTQGGAGASAPKGP
jgi:hypothetical protein